MVVYLGSPCAELSSCLSRFIPCEGKPSIKKMASVASSMGTLSAIVNADIVLAPRTKTLDALFPQANLKCAVSYRMDLDSGFRVDFGLDAFFAQPDVWKAVAGSIDPGYAIGRIQWDNFVLGFFVQNYGRRCADLTPMKLLHHPKHESREDQNWQPPKSRYLNHVWPSTTIN